MNDLVLNFLPIDSNFRAGTVSAALNRSTFNSVLFNGGLKESPNALQFPKIFWGITVNGGGGWASSGIVGTYYANNDFTGSSFQRADLRIDIPNTTVLPGGSLATDPVFGVIPATNFSVKWIGSLIPKYTDTCTFKIRSGGTMTLKVAGTTVATATSSSGWVSGSYNFTAGSTYSVEVDYVQGTGPWGAQLHWLSTGAHPFPEEAISPATPIGANLGDIPNSLANGCFCAVDYQSAINGGAGPALDSSGWPTGDFAVEQMSDPNYSVHPGAFPNGFTSDGATGLWTITFKGAADLHFNGVNSNYLLGYNDGQSRTTTTIGGVTYYKYGSTLLASSLGYHSATDTGYNSATNTTRVLWVHDAGDGYANLGLANTDRNGVGAPGQSGTPARNGVTHLTCMRPTTIGAMTSLAPGTVVNPAFLKALSPYVVFRDNGYAYFLDAAAATSSPPTDWSHWSKPIFNSRASNTSASVPGGVEAWEWRIQIANQSGRDLYINLPVTASGNVGDSYYQDSFIYQLAYLIKNGSTYNGVYYPGLLPHLNVYIEYGNETWNAGGGGSRVFVVNPAMDSARTANTLDWQQYIGMGGYYAVGGDGHLTDAKTTLWNALRIKGVSDIFRVVFGDSAMPGGPAGVNNDPRIRPIFEWQSGGDWNGEGYSVENALNSIASYFGVTINHIYWGGGGAWYANNSPSGSDANGVFAWLATSADVSPWDVSGPISNSMMGNFYYLAKYGLRGHVGYEGGFDIGGNDNAATAGTCLANNDSRITPYTAATINQFFQYGGGLPVVEQGLQPSYGYDCRWTTADGIYNPLTPETMPPKLQAYLDAMATLPTAVDTFLTVPSMFSYLSTGFNYPNPDSHYQVFYVPAYGRYLIGGVTDWNWGPFGTGLIHVVLDGVEIGAYQTTTMTGHEAFWFPVIMGPGIHGTTFYVTNLTGSFTLNEWGVTS